MQGELRVEGVKVIAPVRENMADPLGPGLRGRLNARRRIVETVNAQLAGRLEMERIWARDRWHLTARVARKVLAHNLNCYLNKLNGRRPLLSASSLLLLEKIRTSRLCDADENIFEVYYTTLPEAQEGKLFIKTSSVNQKRFRCAVMEDACVFIRTKEPHVFEYVIATANDDDSCGEALGDPIPVDLR